MMFDHVLEENDDREIIYNSFGKKLLKYIFG